MKLFVVVFLLGFGSSAGLLAGNSSTGKRGAKDAAVNKVIELFDNLIAKCQADLKEEVQLFDEFKLWKEETHTAKNNEIDLAKAAITEAESDNTTAQQELSKNKVDLKKKEEELETTQKDLKEATEKRNAGHELFKKDKAQLDTALKASEDAIQVIKNMKIQVEDPTSGGSAAELLQMQQSIKTVKYAVALADTMGLVEAGERSAVAFFQNPDATDASELNAYTHSQSQSDYKFHSEEVIKLLTKLKREVEKEMAKALGRERDALKAFDLFREQSEHDIGVLTEDIANLKTRNAELLQHIAEAEAAHKEATAVKDAAIQYNKELVEMFKQRQKTYVGRRKNRKTEIKGLKEARKIIAEEAAKEISASTVRLVQQDQQVLLASEIVADPSAMATIESEAEAVDSKSFLQIRSTEDPVHKIQEFLRSQGRSIKSELLVGLASQIHPDDPFKKVKTLIRQLMTKLQREIEIIERQGVEADNENARNTARKEAAEEKIAELEADLATIKAEIEVLVARLKENKEVVTKLTADLKEATKLRKAEKKSNDQAVEEATKGAAAVRKAIGVLEKHYAEIKGGSFVQGPAEDAPSTGFDAGEEYTGNVDAKGGIVGLLEVMVSDFERTVKVTQENEATAESEFLKFETATTSELNIRNQDTDVAKREKKEAKKNQKTWMEELKVQQKLLKDANAGLKKTADRLAAGQQSFAERDALRQKEIEGLRKAWDILDEHSQEFKTDHFDH